MLVTEREPNAHIQIERCQDATILVAVGVVDTLTYQYLRDEVIKAALEVPRAVIVDVDGLVVPSPSAWSVFTSARWHVSVWPDVPIMLTSSNLHTRRAIEAVGVARYVPVHPSREAALDAADELKWHYRRRARTKLPNSALSVRLARARIHEWLTAWSRTDLISVAGTVASVFVQNVVEHTDSEPVLIAENYKDTVTVAVEDYSPHHAVRHEDAVGGAELVSGLAIVAALCRAWGTIPTASGKTVWALVGAENRI